MWMFETDFFDEHIEAVRNRAARKAYEVVEILLILATFIYMRVTDEMYPVLLFIIIGILGVGSILRRYYERKGGFNPKVRREAMFQLGKTTKAKPYLIRQIFYAATWIVICSVAYVRFDGVSWYTIVILLSMIGAISIYFVYSATHSAIYKRPPWLKNPEEEKDL